MAAIKFGTDGWRAIIAKDYTFDNLSRVTAATGNWLKTLSDAPSAMVGYDCRFLGREFAEQTAVQLADMGVKVFLTPKFVSTPMISLATMQRQCSAGLIITASHNPPNYNGFKVKGSFGGPAYPSMITEIENLTPDTPVSVDTNKLEAYLDSKQVEYYDAEALYQNQLKQSFDWKAIRNSGITVGYDAMYGAGQNVMRDLFPKATLLHCAFNPSFEGQAPEPIARNLQPFQQRIKADGIQFGLATDGDADRIGLFDENAEFVDSHHILLLLVHYLHKYKGMKGKVVCTFSVTSKLKALCAHYGIELQVTKIGFKYIGEIMANETVLVGGEESGGIAVAGHIPERDGIYIGLTLLEFMAETGKTLPALIQEVYDIVGSFKMGRNDLHIAEDKKWKVMDGCKAGDFKQFGDYTVESVEDIDGYKFHLGNDSWVMIRPSGTEPVLRVYAEGEDNARVEGILKQAVAAIKTYAS